MRLTWNVWPSTRIEAAKIVVPLAAVYSPVKALASMPVSRGVEEVWACVGVVWRAEGERGGKSRARAAGGVFFRCAALFGAARAHGGRPSHAASRPAPGQAHVWAVLTRACAACRGPPAHARVKETRSGDARHPSARSLSTCPSHSAPSRPSLHSGRPIRPRPLQVLRRHPQPLRRRRLCRPPLDVRAVPRSQPLPAPLRGRVRVQPARGTLPDLHVHRVPDAAAGARPAARLHFRRGHVPG